VGERVACEGAYQKALDLGYNSFILSSLIDGEAGESGNILVNIAHEIQVYDVPLKKPAIIVAAGENIMHINIPNPGMGGPSQHCALGAALALEGVDGIVVGAVDTDGTDGPTDMAGGLVDSSTIKYSEEIGVDIREYMSTFNDTEALKKLSDVIYTGPTGTNINDLRVIAIV